MNIVLATDSNYLVHAEVTIKSLVAHHQNINIFVLHADQVSHTWVEQLNQIVGARGIKVMSANVSAEMLQAFKGNGYISNSTYLRYYIERLFPYGNGNKWLYLDSDTIVNGYLGEPFETEAFSQNMLLAIQDPYVMNLPNYPFMQDAYFNAGVLYINAQHWKGMEAKLIEFTLQNQAQLRFGDQDVLNAVVGKQWQAIPMVYNYQCMHMYNPQIAKGEPPVFHFTGEIKPWHDVPQLYYRSMYWHYFRLDWYEVVAQPIGHFKAEFVKLT
ncbi:glycosyltransferase family 8 protein [Actinobacillus equuli subsp. haemolyticus]|nr:glycosyltransferase family 8 protein [Actinobacillus equuli subsp. haemolyticus]